MKKPFDTSERASEVLRLALLEGVSIRKISCRLQISRKCYRARRPCSWRAGSDRLRDGDVLGSVEPTIAAVNWARSASGG